MSTTRRRAAIWRVAVEIRRSASGWRKQAKPLGRCSRGIPVVLPVFCYSPSGLHLASAGEDHKICVWNSGVSGDFSLIWCTRSAANPLPAHGLRLRGAVGLQADQLALLAYAGCEETETVVSVMRNNTSTLFSGRVRNQHPVLVLP